MPRRFFLRAESKSPTHSGASRAPWIVWISLAVAIAALLIAGEALFDFFPADRETTAVPASSPRELIGSSRAEVDTTDEQIISHADSVVADSVSEVEANTTGEMPVEAESEPEPVSRTIRLQVLNGCGVRGIARRVAPALRRMGFDVRESGNAKNFKHEFSRIYDRRGNPAWAYRVADSLGMDSSRVGTLPDPNVADIDVTIVVGADYTNLNFGISTRREE